MRPMVFILLAASAVASAQPPALPLPRPATTHGAVSLVHLPAVIVMPPANKPVTVSWTIACRGTNQPAVLLQRSINLKSWCDLGFFPDTNGNYSFQDAGGNPMGFYRAMTLGSYQVVTNLTAGSNQP